MWLGNNAAPMWTTALQLRAAANVSFADDSLYSLAKRAGIDAGRRRNNTEFVKMLRSVGVVGLDLNELAAGANVTVNNEDAILLFASLPETFALKRIAAMLFATGKFVNATAARLAATSGDLETIREGLKGADGFGLMDAFELGDRHANAMATNGTLPGGATRFEQVGIAFTSLTFTEVVFEAQRRAGIAAPTPSDQLKLIKLWNCIASLQGLGAAGQPRSVADATNLLALIRRSNEDYGWSSEGQQLLLALQAFTERTEDGSEEMFRRFARTQTLITLLNPPTPR